MSSVPAAAARTKRSARRKPRDRHSKDAMQRISETAAIGHRTIDPVYWLNRAHNEVPLLALVVIYDSGSRGEAACDSGIGFQIVHELGAAVQCRGAEGAIDHRLPAEPRRMPSVDASGG